MTLLVEVMKVSHRYRFIITFPIALVLVIVGVDINGTALVSYLVIVAEGVKFLIGLLNRCVLTALWLVKCLILVLLIYIEMFVVLVVHNGFIFILSGIISSGMDTVEVKG